MRDVHGLLHLRGGIRKHTGVRAGGSALAVTGMGEEAGGAPEELLAGLLLRFFEFVGDGVEGGIAFGECVEFRRDIAIMPAVVIDAELVHELEAGPDAALRVGDGVAVVIPRTLCGAAAEGIGERVAHGVPVGDAETQVIAHFFAAHEFVGVVMLEGKDAVTVIGGNRPKDVLVISNIALAFGVVEVFIPTLCALIMVIKQNWLTSINSINLLFIYINIT